MLSYQSRSISRQCQALYYRTSTKQPHNKQTMMKLSSCLRHQIHLVVVIARDQKHLTYIRSPILTGTYQFSLWSVIFFTWTWITWTKCEPDLLFKWGAHIHITTYHVRGSVKLNPFSSGWIQKWWSSDSTLEVLIHLVLSSFS